MLSVFKRELRSLFCGYKAYSFAAIFALCYLAVRMIYNYMLLYENAYGFFNQEYILALLPAALALSAPVITFSAYDEERKYDVFYFLRTLPLSYKDIFWGKYLSRIALFGIVYAILTAIDIILGFYSGVSVLTAIYSVVSYVFICFVILAINVFVATALKNKFTALGVSYGIGVALTALTAIRYLWSRTALKIIEPISILGTYAPSVFGVVDVSYIILWLSLCALFTYLSYTSFKKEFKL